MPRKENEDGLMSWMDCLVMVYNGTLKQVVDDEVNLRILQRTRLVSAGKASMVIDQDINMRKARLEGMRSGLEVIILEMADEETKEVKEGLK